MIKLFGWTDDDYLSKNSCNSSNWKDYDYFGEVTDCFELIGFVKPDFVCCDLEYLDCYYYYMVIIEAVLFRSQHQDHYIYPIFEIDFYAVIIIFSLVSAILTNNGFLESFMINLFRGISFEVLMIIRNWWCFFSLF